LSGTKHFIPQNPRLAHAGHFSFFAMFKKRHPAESVLPYSRLAEIYDHVMRHVDYVHWASYVESLFNRHLSLPEQVLDLACGTGSLAIELHRRGYEVSGADGCLEMLSEGRKKASNLGYPISFFHRNLLDLHDMPTFDAVLCLYDSINYMMTLEDMATAFEMVGKVIKPGGLFVFDACTESNSLQHFNDMKEEDIGDGFSYVRHSYFKAGIQFNQFDIHFEAEDERAQEVHQQRIYALSDIKAVLEASPFEVEGIYSGFGFSSPSELSDRVHFVLRG
jgi:ubiquinone/menaquinone biosynthesis C-methylase UbiE